MVDLYTIRRRLDGVFYEDVVAARSWEEAEVLAEKIGGEVTGKILEEIFVDNDEMASYMRPDGMWSLAKEYRDG